MLTIRHEFMGIVGAAFLSGSLVYSGKPFPTEDSTGASSPQNFPSRVSFATTRTVSETLEEQRVEMRGNTSRETTSTATTSITQKRSLTHINSGEEGQERSSSGCDFENFRQNPTVQKKNKR